MSLTLLKGDGAWLQSLVLQSSGAPSFSTAMLIDASAEKCAFVGNIWHPTVKSGTINIRKVHFRCGALTFNVLSTMRVSLQTVSATAGSPYQPDGSQDQTYDFALGAGLTANAWNATGALSADRAVDLSAYSIGDTNSRSVAVVFEFQTFTAADSIIISCMNSGSSSAVLNTNLGGATLLNTASWAVLNSGIPVVAFECDDGSFAFMDCALPFSALSSVTTSSTAAIRAAGLKFRFPVEINTDAASLGILVANGADGNLVLYDTDGTTALVTINIDNDAVYSQTAMLQSMARYLPKTHTANSYYRLAWVPSTSTNSTVYYGDVNAAGIMDGFVMGQDAHWTQRDSAGAWTDTTTRRPHFGLKLSSVHDGSGGAVAMPVSGRICA